MTQTHMWGERLILKMIVPRCQIPLGDKEILAYPEIFHIVCNQLQQIEELLFMADLGQGES